MNNVENSNVPVREKWADVFKAIMIILVVLGHATGKFNMYVYQFHVAVFFFISGWTSKLYEKSFFEILIKRFLELMVPFYFLHYISNLFGIGTSWLGAMWFVRTLFSCLIVQKLFLMIFRNKVGIGYFVLSAFLFLYAYYANFGAEKAGFDLKIGVCQFYIFLGVVFRRYGKKIDFVKSIGKFSMLVRLFAVIVCLFLMVFIKRKFHLAMDIASMKINTPWADFFVILNGAILIYNLSILMSKIEIKFVKNMFSVVGRYTFGIMVFHFLGFKLVTLILLLCGRGGVQISDIASQCPPQHISQVFWSLYVVIPIIISIVVWKILKSIPFVRIVIGADKEFEKMILQYFAASIVGKTFFELEENLMLNAECKMECEVI